MSEILLEEGGKNFWVDSEGVGHKRVCNVRHVGYEVAIAWQDKWLILCMRLMNCIVTTVNQQQRDHKLCLGSISDNGG